MFETNDNSKYSTKYLDEFIKPLFLTLPKISEYIKTFKDKDGNKHNKLMSFRINEEKLLRKYKAVWTKNEDLKKNCIKKIYLFWWSICKD